MNLQDVREDGQTEFKELLNDGCIKAIIAFLNTHGGTLFLGVNDAKDVIGLQDAHSDLEKLSNKIKMMIEPIPEMLVRLDIKTIEGKNIIIANVSKGFNLPYYLKSKGPTSSGVFIRLGNTSIPADSKTIMDLIIQGQNISFERNVSQNQKLTFNYCQKSFLEKNINLEQENMMRNLGIKDDNNNYTNLGLLLSDQNPFPTKIGVYNDESKLNFLDLKEVTGSVLEQLDTAIKYIDIYNTTQGEITEKTRVDKSKWEPFIIREILANAYLHQSYAMIAPTIINIYKDKFLEVISLGGLVPQITIDDVFKGISVSRNSGLMAVFLKLSIIEGIGSGIKRVRAFMSNKGLDIDIISSENSFVVKIPDLLVNEISAKKQILLYFESNDLISRIEAEKLLGKGKTYTNKIINNMIEDGILELIGNNKSSKYRSKLNQLALEMLRNTVESTGNIIKIKTLSGLTVQCGSKRSFSPANPKEEADIEYALELLLENQYIKPANHKNEIYKATKKSFDLYD